MSPSNADFSYFRVREDSKGQPGYQTTSLLRKPACKATPHAPFFPPSFLESPENLDGVMLVSTNPRSLLCATAEQSRSCEPTFSLGICQPFQNIPQRTSRERESKSHSKCTFSAANRIHPLRPALVGVRFLNSKPVSQGGHGETCLPNPQAFQEAKNLHRGTARKTLQSRL